MLSSIAASGRWSALKPTNIVPWSVTVPYGMLRRKILPKRSWSVLGDVRVGGLVLELDAVELRPPHRQLLLAVRAAPPTRRASCSHFCSSRTVPPAPGLPSGTSTSPGASISVGFSVPSMKPVRSRSCWYGQLEVSSATVASPASAAIAARAVSKITSYAPPESQSTASCWVAGIVKPSVPTTAR